MKHFYAYRIFLLLTFFAAFYGQTSAQNFHLVKDINTSTDANPGGYVMFNGVSYFSADDGVNRKGLWRTDGTTEGTLLVKGGISPNNITVSNGKLFFAGTGNPGLWMSDGTEAGTVRVLSELPAGTTNFAPSELQDLNGVLFFAVSGGSYNTELWKTDGTANGTVRVKDFYNSDWQLSMSGIFNLLAIKNKLYFTISGLVPSGYGPTLAVSDGTSEGTYVISKDIFDPHELTPASNSPADSLVYFTASTTGTANRTLYISNGEPGNVSAASGFNAFTTNNFWEPHLVNLEGKIYFIGHQDASTSWESLYKYDPQTASSPQPVKLIPATNKNGRFSFASRLHAVNGTLYFNVYDAETDKNQFWRSNGTDAGNTLLKDHFFVADLLSVNDLTYLVANDDVSGYELWKTDGTVNGTSTVKDIDMGAESSSPSYPTELSGNLIFSANDGLHGNEVWFSDGTPTGTRQLKDINQTSTASATPDNFSQFNNKLLFFATSNLTGYVRTIFTSDGTTRGTSILNDTVYNPISFGKRNVRDKYFYFFGFSKKGTRLLYKTNGTTNGTVLVKDFLANLGIKDGLIATDSLIYFCLSNIQNGWDLWRSDGTEGGTYIIGENYDPSNMLAIHNEFYFVKNTTNLCKTDGTSTGTVLLRSFSNTPNNLTDYNGTLLFTAFDGSKNALWRSNGTVAGTVKVTDKVSYPNNFICSKDRLFFTASGDPTSFGYVGTELFKTDGTDAGTVLVKDIEPGSGSSIVNLPISYGGSLYFFAMGTNNNDIDLWKSDGTETGTKAISSIGSIWPTKLEPCNGKLFFFIGNTLLQSDTTVATAQPVQDNIFSTVTINSYNGLIAIGNTLFFAADSYKYGQELYAGTISKPGVTYYISIANGNWSDPSTWASNVVPPEGASVIIRHNVVGNVNTSCKELRIEEPGNLTMLQDFNIKILE